MRDEIKDAITKSDIAYYVFRRSDAWNNTESPAVKILDDECKNSRPPIKEMVEKHIQEYPFEELDKDHIGEVVWEVVMNKIFGKD